MVIEFMFQRFKTVLVISLLPLYISQIIFFELTIYWYEVYLTEWRSYSQVVSISAPSDWGLTMEAVTTKEQLDMYDYLDTSVMDLRILIIFGGMNLLVNIIQIAYNSRMLYHMGPKFFSRGITWVDLSFGIINLSMTILVALDLLGRNVAETTNARKDYVGTMSQLIRVF